MIIHSGDCSNYRDPYRNEQEVRNFIEWYKSLRIAYKIYVAGNHDSSIEKRLITKEHFDKAGIIYLENESVTINGLKIYGTPYTPTFCDWSFMKARDKIYRVWDAIPEDTNILVVHGPPKTILDLSYDRVNNLEFCGCSALMKRINKLPMLKYCMFGHIHNCKDIKNAGVKTVYGMNTIFSNGACVEDGRFDKGLINHGNIFEI
jgi:Icc-related predicted phosphoesterase